MFRSAMAVSAILVATGGVALGQDLELDWWSVLDPDEVAKGVGRAVATDPQGNLLVAASVGPNLAEDYGVLKYSPAGERLWVRTFNGAGDFIDLALKIGADLEGNVYVGGHSWSGGNFGEGPKYDVVVIKYSPDGEQLWVSTYNSPSNNDDFLDDMVVTPDGKVYVAGYSYGPIGQPADAEYTVLGIDGATGELEWDAFFDGSQGEISWLTARICADEAGAPYLACGVEIDGVTGAFAGVKYDPATGEELWASEWVNPTPFCCEYTLIQDCTIDLDGNLIIAGRYNDTVPPDDIQGFGGLAKFAPDGTLLWSQGFGGVTTHTFTTVDTDEQGRVFVAGAFNVEEPGGFAHADHLAVAYSADGEYLWEHRAGGDTTNFDGEGFVKVDGNGIVKIATRNINEATGEDVWVLAYDPATGEVLFDTSYDFGDSERPFDMVLDADDNLCVTGASHLADFGWRVLTMRVAEAGGSCPGDFDANGELNILDFVAFQNAFQAGDLAADANGDGALNILDFVAFQDQFQAGC